MGFSRMNCGKMGPQIFPFGANVSIFLSPGQGKRQKEQTRSLTTRSLSANVVLTFHRVRTSFCKKPLSSRSMAFLFFPEPCFFPHKFEGGWVQTDRTSDRGHYTAASSGKFSALRRTWRPSYFGEEAWRRGRGAGTIYIENASGPCAKQGQEASIAQRKRERVRKNSIFFRKNFVRYNRLEYMGESRLEREKWIKKWISCQGKNRVKPVCLGFGYLYISIRN